MVAVQRHVAQHDGARVVHARASSAWAALRHDEAAQRREPGAGLGHGRLPETLAQANDSDFTTWWSPRTGLVWAWTWYELEATFIGGRVTSTYAPQ
jgi:hypothetical protein